MNFELLYHSKEWQRWYPHNIAVSLENFVTLIFLCIISPNFFSFSFFAIGKSGYRFVRNSGEFSFTSHSKLRIGENGSPRILYIHIFIWISALTITWQLNWYFVLIFKLLGYCRITFDNQLLLTLVYFRWYSGNRSSVWHLLVVWYFVFIMVFVIWCILYLAFVWQLCSISIACHSCGIKVPARGELDESFIDLLCHVTFSEQLPSELRNIKSAFNSKSYVLRVFLENSKCNTVGGGQLTFFPRP